MAHERQSVQDCVASLNFENEFLNLEAEKELVYGSAVIQMLNLSAGNAIAFWKLIGSVKSCCDDNKQCSGF